MSEPIPFPRLHRTQGIFVPQNPPRPTLSIGQWVSLALGLLIGIPLLYLAICAMLVMG